MDIKKIAMYGKQKPEPEITQGGYKSFGQAIGQYLSPEGSEPNTIRRFLSNIANSARELTGTDDESLAQNQANYNASVEQVDNIGKYVPQAQKDRIDSMASRWGTNMASNVGAVAPISKAVRAQNLARFMEGSKVQEPVYHGTNKDFTEFKNDYAGKNTNDESAYVEWSKIGSNFSTSPKYASDHADEFINGSVMPVYVKMKNPYEMTERDWASTLEEMVNGETNAESFRDGLINDGHDGIMLHTMDNGIESTHLITFSPNQIKSATGNRGTFDPNDPNILHGVGLAGAGGNQDEKKSKMSMYGK